MLQARRSRGSIPYDVIANFDWRNPYNRTMVPGVDPAFNINKYQETS
jgi:hypothetical protein